VSYEQSAFSGQPKELKRSNTLYVGWASPTNNPELLWFGL